MEKEKIIEIAYNVIVDGLEWASPEKSQEYASYVDGVNAFKEALINELKKEESNKSKPTWITEEVF